MTVAGVWIRIAAGCGVAAALAFAASPPAPARWLGWEPLAVGVAAGVGLFYALARIRPPVPPAVAAVLVVLAGAEEVSWRWFALGELATRAGPAAALIATSVGFGLAHPGARLLHTATGIVFGGVYLATGSLVAAWAAHAAYNLSVVAAARASP
jgi:membrane protease YdiL (CAAX protease family)